MERPNTTELITDHKLDKDCNYAQCKECRGFIPAVGLLIDNIEFCPYCGLRVDSIHNGKWLSVPQIDNYKNL